MVYSLIKINLLVECNCNAILNNSMYLKMTITCLAILYGGKIFYHKETIQLLNTRASNLISRGWIRFPTKTSTCWQCALYLNVLWKQIPRSSICCSNSSKISNKTFTFNNSFTIFRSSSGIKWENNNNYCKTLSVPEVSRLSELSLTVFGCGK